MVHLLYVPGVLAMPAYFAVFTGALGGDHLAFTQVSLKVLPVLLLMYAAVAAGRASARAAGRAGVTRYSVLVAAGLTFSMMGDALLEFDGLRAGPEAAGRRKTSDFFLYGLVAFLVGHLCYTAAFLSLTAAFAPAAALPFAGLGVAAFSYIRPGLPPGLLLPVLVYTVAIAVMGWRASAAHAAAAPGRERTALLAATVGAFVFMVSDLIIAVSAFRVAVPNGKVAVMLTYYLAQLLISGSVMGVTGVTGGGKRKRKRT